MRRSHQEIRKLVAARVTDYVAGDASESVLRAALKALRLDEAEINIEVWKIKARIHELNLMMQRALTMPVEDAFEKLVGPACYATPVAVRYPPIDKWARANSRVLAEYTKTDRFKAYQDSCWSIRDGCIEPL